MDEICVIIEVTTVGHHQTIFQFHQLSTELDVLSLIWKTFKSLKLLIERIGHLYTDFIHMTGIKLVKLRIALQKLSRQRPLIACAGGVVDNLSE